MYTLLAEQNLTEVKQTTGFNCFNAWLKKKKTGKKMQGPSFTFKINYIRCMSYITKAFAELKELEACTHSKSNF